MTFVKSYNENEAYKLVKQEEPSGMYTYSFDEGDEINIKGGNNAVKASGTTILKSEGTLRISHTTDQNRPRSIQVASANLETGDVEVKVIQTITGDNQRVDTRQRYLARRILG